MTPYQLPHLEFLRIRTELIPPPATHLPSFIGSTIRGAVGTALKDAVCVAAPSQACESCFFRRGCHYGRLFRRPVEGTIPPFLTGVGTPPRPYVLDVPAPSTDTQADDGQALTPVVVGITLVGDAILAAQMVTRALQVAARNGLCAGRKEFGIRDLSWQHANGDWLAVDRLLTTTLDSAEFTQHLPGDVIHPETVRIDFLTPTQIPRLGIGPPEGWPRVMIFSALRRVLELAHFYQSESAVNWDITSPMSSARSVVLLDAALRRFQSARYSTTQQQRVPLEGVVGRMTLRGLSADLVSLLRMAEVLHLGKKASLGFGRIVLHEG